MQLIDVMEKKKVTTKWKARKDGGEGPELRVLLGREPGRCSHRVFLAHGIRQSARCVALGSEALHSRHFSSTSIQRGLVPFSTVGACCFRRAVTAVPVPSSLCPTQGQFVPGPLVRSGTHLTVIFIPRIGRPPAWSGPFGLHHTPAHTHFFRSAADRTTPLRRGPD